MLVVRAPFNQTWQRLPATLEKAGMKVTDSTRSTGSITATYKPLSDSAWQELGAADPGLTWAIIKFRSVTSITAAVCSLSILKVTR